MKKGQYSWESGVKHKYKFKKLITVVIPQPYPILKRHNRTEHNTEHCVAYRFIFNLHR